MLWRNATTRQIFPWLWQGLQVSLHLGDLFSGSLCVELTILDILQGSTGASLPPGSLPSACRRQSGFLLFGRVKGSPCLEHGWACDWWGNLLKMQSDLRGVNSVRKAGWAPGFWGGHFAHVLTAGSSHPQSWVLTTAYSTAFLGHLPGPSGVTGLTFPPWGQKWIQATLARAFYCQGAIHLVLFLH